MILVADAGSTKTQWLFDGENVITTLGINPLFQSIEDMHQIIAANDQLCAIAPQIKELNFYGAACSSEERNDKVKAALSLVFKEAKILVEHDLMGAAVAVFQGKPTIACILGTGSNSCFFDGKNLMEEIPSLGFILGDEGSGGAFGKTLVIDFLYHKMPAASADLFFDTYKITKEEVIENVYRKPNPNRYLASFASFLSVAPDKAYIHKMVINEFDSFVQKHVLCYKNAKECEIGFVGSLAAIFQQEMATVLQQYQLQMGKIEQRPIFSIYNYHKKS